MHHHNVINNNTSSSRRTKSKSTEDMNMGKSSRSQPTTISLKALNIEEVRRKLTVGSFLILTLELKVDWPSFSTGPDFSDSSTLKRMLKPMPSTESPVTSPEMGRRRYGGQAPCPPSCGTHGHRHNQHAHHGHYSHVVNNNSRQSSQRYPPTSR